VIHFFALPARRVAAQLLTGLWLCVAAAVGANAQTLVQNNWEDGTVQGWSPFGNVSLLNSVGAANSGTRSLLTTGRTAGYNGPGVNLAGLLVPGATYQVTVWARLLVTTPATPATQVSMTVQRTAGGSTTYDGVASATANDSGWVKLAGLYSFAGPAPSGLTLYVESASATASYYIDDFSVELVSGAAGPPPNTTGLNSNFETGTAQGWQSRTGRETVAPSASGAHGGNFALLTTGRTAPYAGPAYDVTNVMFNGSSYDVSVWVKLAPSAAGQTAQMRVSLQRDAGSFTTYHTVIGNTTVGAGAWVRLSGTYPLALAGNRFTLYVESDSGTQDFLIDDVLVGYVAPPSIDPNIPPLSLTLSPYFKVGTIGYPAGIVGVPASLVTKHFNSMTSENDMKWQPIEPTPGAFDFANADAQVSFARANGIQMRGHTLAWHAQTPDWVFQDAAGNPLTPSPSSRALVLARLNSHITGVLNHFAPNVSTFYAWDVVNEAIDPSQANCLRVSPWSQLTGTDFIDTAFRTARALLPPSVKLYYNDYNTSDADKLACLIRIVSGMKARGVPIDGIGHQTHINLYYPGVAVLADAIKQLAAAFPGIDQQMTEMDISIGTDNDNYASIPAEVLARQGYAFRNYMNMFKSLRGLISSVTFWGQSDDHTWLTNGSVVDAPLLFDRSLKAKPAYWGIVDPRQLPGASLSGSITSKTGAASARVWTLQLSNRGPGTAFAAQITGFNLRQTAGAACTPVVGANAPINLGDVVAGASATASVTIDFSSCPALATFTVDVPFNSSAGWNGDPAKGSPALSISRSNQFR
jgi:endo-1,4-beta-xylanase